MNNIAIIWNQRFDYVCYVRLPFFNFMCFGIYCIAMYLRVCAHMKSSIISS